MCYLVTLTLILALLISLPSCEAQLQPCAEVGSNFTPYSATTEPIPPGVRFEEFASGRSTNECGEILSRGIVNTTYLKYNSAYKYVLLDYLYTKNFQDKQQLIDVGIGGNLNIPGLPALFGGDGSFKKESYQSWRNEYRAQRNEEIQQSTSTDFLETRIDENVVAAWRHCKTLEGGSRNRGIQALLVPISRDFAELYVWFLPIIEPGGILSTVTLTADVDIIGGTADCFNSAQFTRGTEMDATVRKLLIRRTPNVMLQVRMTFDGTHNQSLKLNPPPSPNKLYFANTRALTSDKLYRGDTAEIVWEVLNTQTVFLNNHHVTSTGSQRVEIRDSAAYVLKWENSVGGFDYDTIYILGQQKPPMLKSASVLLATPSWADGKNNNNSHLSIELFVTKNDGQVVVGRGSLEDGTEIAPGQALPVPIQFPDTAVLNFTIDELNSANFIMRYRKHDTGLFSQDQWTFRAEFSLIFDQGLVVYSGYNEPATALNFEDETKPYYFPTVAGDALVNKTARTLIIPCQ